DQRAPASVSLASTSTDLSQSGLTVARGVRIATDPRGSITLSSNNKLAIDGVLEAPSGTISASLTTTVPGVDSGQALTLGPNARLLTRGAFVSSSTPAPGLVQGQLLNAGSITLKASKASVAVAPGAVLDVSAAAPVQLDVVDKSALIPRI